MRELRRRPKPRWLIEDVLPEQGVGSVFGPTYSGKTFVCIDLALTVANGLSYWHGFPVNASGPVVYVAMEGSFDFVDRIDAWLLAHADQGVSDDNFFVLMEEAVDLASLESLGRLLEDIRELSPALVIIDTQALATAGTEENSNTEMTLVMRNIKKLAQVINGLVMTVHHTGWPGANGQVPTRARGASAQRAALDVEIGVLNGNLVFTKIKAAAPPGPRPFTLTPSGESVWAESPGGTPDDRVYKLLIEIGEPGITAKQASGLLSVSDKQAKRLLDRFVDSHTTLAEKVPGSAAGPGRGREPDVYRLLPHILTLARA